MYHSCSRNRSHSFSLKKNKEKFHIVVGPSLASRDNLSIPGRKS
uniref:Uncharacterized protein n=1 Tax=Rhizophora mucronata TaxID=61149 RepID=A0A2P2N9J9_RHIMU